MVRVSVIIPIYNAEPWLGACLDSVLDQTLHDIEVVCVNDGSTDGSAAVLSAYAQKDSRVKVQTQANCGQGAARNRALEIARGEYVCFMDADDALADSGVFERLTDEATRERLDALFFDAETHVDEGVSVRPTVVRAEDYVRRHDYSDLQTGRQLFARFLKNREFTVSPCLVLLRREALERGGVRFPEARVFHEDNIFMTHVFLTVERASHRPWRCYIRKVHSGSTVTSRPTMRHLRGYLACYCDVCRLLSGEGWDKRTRAALVDRRTVYKLHVRRLIDGNPELASVARDEMSGEEYATLQSVLAYPFCEKVVNAFRCLRDRGLCFTVRRILFGRQDK